MENLTRYEISGYDCGQTCTCGMDIAADGEWVKFSDVVELLQTSHNKQSTPLPNCISCGNDKCSMQAGVCSKWLPAK